jgi:hypothetical protein
MFKNVSGQKIRVFAFDKTDASAKTGDAANITGKVAIDHGTATAITDTNPTEVEDGYYLFDLTQAETNGDVLDFYPQSSTADIAVIGVPGTVYTIPQYFPDVTISSGGVPEVNSTQIEGSDATDQINSEVDTALSDIGLDHMFSAAVVGTDIADNSFAAQLTSNSATADFDDYDNTTDSLPAIAASSGSSITDIINPIYEIPSPDIQGTLTTRIAIQLTNALDDLPSTAEITPGTIKIETRNPSATSWTTVRNDVAMSENAGKIYYDETFSSSNGYAEGDQLRFTFKSQKVTVSANDYEINDATGTIKQSRVNLDNTAKNKLGLISTDRTVTLPLVSNDDIIRINRNRDYTATIGNSPFIFVQDGTTQDFTGFSTFKMQLTKQADALSGDSTIEITDADLTGAGTSSQQVTFNIAAADTANAALTDTTNLNAASLSTNYYAYTFEAIVCSGSGQEIVIGTGWIDMRDSQASSC